MMLALNRSYSPLCPRVYTTFSKLSLMREDQLRHFVRRDGSVVVESQFYIEIAKDC